MTSEGGGKVVMELDPQFTGVLLIDSGRLGDRGAGEEGGAGWGCSLAMAMATAPRKGSRWEERGGRELGLGGPCAQGVG